MMKTVIITGASRGIGAAVAGHFARNGFNVCVNFLNSEDAARSLAREIGGIAVKADVADPVQVNAMVHEAVRTFGGIDVLVNNAGISVAGLFQDVPDHDVRRLFDVNVFGTMNVSRAVLPDMLRKHSGHIINISSVWGLYGASFEVHYSASKAAVIGFTKALAKELMPSGIKVNCICPGFVNTDMNSRLSALEIQQFLDGTDSGLPVPARDIADVALLLACSALTGQTVSVDN
jgi:3-oxoacyl-[acyl-carrier protein] reductase